MSCVNECPYDEPFNKTEYQLFLETLKQHRLIEDFAFLDETGTRVTIKPVQPLDYVFIDYNQTDEDLDKI